MKQFEEEEKKKAKQKLNKRIKECKEKLPRNKKFHEVYCISTQELKSMPVDEALNCLDADYYMFKDSGKRLDLGSVFNIFRNFGKAA